MPEHSGHAPYGLLNEKFLGCNSSKERPHCGQAKCWLNERVGPSSMTTWATPSARRRAVSSESVRRRSMPSFRTRRSTTTSIVCWKYRCLLYTSDAADDLL